MPTHQIPQQRPSQQNLRLDPFHHAPPSQPTIWIVTYAHRLAKSEAAVHKILATELPSGTPHLYTIHAYNFTPPPPHVCDAYSGVSSIVQGYVMQDARARRAVSEALDSILSYGKQSIRMEREGGRPVKRDVAISVCCMYGTHRSVSIAEKIAQGLMGMRLGVKVVVRHVHRTRRINDPR